MLRHRTVPERVFGTKLIVARPSDGAPVVLEPDAVLVWRGLDAWTTTERIDDRLATVFPQVELEERVAARARVLEMLSGIDLLERA